MRYRFIRSFRWTSHRNLAFVLGTGSSVALGPALWLNRKPILLESHQDVANAEQKPRYTTTSWHSWFSLYQDDSDDVDASGSAKISEPTGTVTQSPPSQTDAENESNHSGSSTGSSAPPKTFGNFFDTFTSFELGSLSDKITRLVLPSWVRLLPGLLKKFQDEMSMAPWSLSWEIWEDAHNPELNPEIIWDASVRISQDLCQEEKNFLAKRRKHTAKALARYLNIPESEVVPEDVPTIAMCGSGGGLRALVAGASSYLSAHETGLFDVVTYSAGVSGSCWLQALYYSSIGELSHQRIIDHLKQRINIHIANPTDALALLVQAPTNKYLLSGFVEKLKGVPDADFGLVDIYGLLLAARLMVPKGELRVSDWDLKVSNQRYYTDDGCQPLPIYTAVRHEIPDVTGNVSEIAKEARFTKKHYDWFQWFEWTPYEFFCEELEAGIPTWAMGRRFHAGNNIWRENGFALPELRVTLMLGIWGSAFCATLSHYYKEVSPLLKSLGVPGLQSLGKMLESKDEDLVKVHPIDPAVIPNYLLGLEGRLPASCPESIHRDKHLALMDAGMSNNLPIYPLLRPGRDVDIIIAFDASADVRSDNWIKVVDGYARKRNIKGWPMGAGWPQAGSTSEEIADDMETAEMAAEVHSDAAIETVRKEQATEESDLNHCTVWVGTTQERTEFMDEQPSRRLGAADDDKHLRASNAGIALIYFPFTANEKVRGVDPMKSDFMSTWNFVYTPDQISEVVALARANFREGGEQTKRTIRAVWERKRAARLEKEREEREYQIGLRLRRGRAAMFRNGDVGHGDQFGGV